MGKNAGYSMGISNRFRPYAFVLIAYACALAIPHVGWAQQPAPSASLPRAKLIDPLHDFGNFEQDSRLTHTFRVMNEGGQPLQIKQVAPDCSCTTMIAHPAQIQPGVTSDFTFEINTAKLSGSFVRYVNVLTNDPVTPTITFCLRGEGRRLVEVSPASVDFGRIQGKDVREQIVTLTNHSGQPLEARIEGPSKSGSFEFDLAETIPGSEYKLFVVLRPTNGTGRVSGIATIGTNLENPRTITFSASAFIPPAVEVVPPRLAFGDPPIATNGAENSVTRVCEVINQNAKPMHLLAASSSNPSLVVGTHEVEPGRLYRVFATLSGPVRPPPAGWSITLKTDASETPEIVIPVSHGASSAPPATKATPQSQPSERAKNPVLELVGKPAPPFSLMTTGHLPLNDSEFKNYPATVLNFVAPNCPFCKRQLPNIEKVRLEYEDRGVRFVNISETLHNKVFTQAQTQEVFDAIEAHLELAIDPGNKVGALYKISNFPALVVISQDGRIIDALVGAKVENAEKLRHVLGTALAAEIGVRSAR